MKSCNLSFSIVGKAILNYCGDTFEETLRIRELRELILRKASQAAIVSQFFVIPFTLSGCARKNGEGYSDGSTIVETMPKNKGPFYYKVGANDNLTFIAEEFGITIDEILYNNPKIKDVSLIRVGDVLYLPVVNSQPDINSKLNGLISNDGVHFMTFLPISTEPVEIVPVETMPKETDSIVNDNVDYSAHDWSEKLKKQGYVKGIDISNWQKSMNLNKVLKNNPEIDFVMVRAGYFVEEGASEGLDDSFVNFAKVCAEANKPMGIYYWPSFFSKEEAEKETKLILDTLSDLKDECGLKLEMPIALDIELKEDGGGTVVKRILEEDPDTLEAIETTINILSEAGYYVTIYIGNNALSSSAKLRKYIESLDVDTWIPKYASNKTTSISSEPTIPNVSYDGFTGIKQYSQTGTIDGYSGNVDLDLAFVNYPKIMREKNLGGFEEENSSLSFRN